MSPMSQKMRFFFLILASVCFIASIRAEDEPKTDPQVKSVMRGNFEALMNLQPYIASPEKFRDPKNQAEIARNIDALSGLKHVFNEKVGKQEPGLAAISELFSEYLKDTQMAFTSGAHGNFTRNQLRTITGFCMACHTRVGTEKNFQDLEQRVKTAELTPFQRAEFYAATRQFDKALKSFDELISKTPEGELSLMEFGQAVRQVLSITIRVKQDPKATFYFLEKLASRDDIPEYFQRYIASWKKDSSDWMKEKKLSKDVSPESLMEKASTLVKRADSMKLFAADPTGDVSYLRATNYIHEAMQKNPKGKFRGEALYLLGTCYDALRDPLLWALDSLYFEACIREFPHTNSSKKCYKSYASKLYFGYTGSGGTFIPEDELKKLGELRKLSE